MKLRNIFTVLAAAALTFVGCQMQEEKFLDEVQVSKSLVALSVDGGSDKITVNATADWKFAEIKDVWPNYIVRETVKETVDGVEVEKEVIKSETPSWLSVNVTSGTAGETEVTLSAEATKETRELVLSLECAGVTQQVRVLQMAEKVETPMSTCAQVIAGEDGVIYRIKGVCTSIANTTYGNWYIDDGTGVVYVYGTLYQGATKQFEKLGLEVGDIVTIEGPRKNYSGTIEMVDVTVLDIEKSLIKVEKVLPEGPISLEGGTSTAVLTVKDGDFSVVIPEDASWLTAGEPYTVGTSTFVDLTAAPNEGGARKTTVTFKTKVDEKEYVAMADIEQAGAIAEVKVADFLAAAEGTSLYKVSGIITKVAKAEYGNVYIKDATGEMYVYGIGSKGDFEKLGLKEGDIVTVVGERSSYNGSPQMKGGQYESHKAVTKMNAGDVAALADDNKNDPANYIMLTGKVSQPASGKYDLETYGNFDLVDESGSIYVYGVSTGWNGETKKFASLGVKENDIITIVAYKTSYNGSAQVVGMYVSHETPAEGGDDNTGDNTGNEGTGNSVTWTLGSGNQSWAADTHATYGAGFAATVDGMKVGYYKNTSQTEPIEPKTDHIRVYQDSYLVITPAEGKKIKSVVVECTGDKLGPIKVGDKEYTATDKVITWTGDVTVFEAYAVKQTRIAKLTIVSE